MRQPLGVAGLALGLFAAGPSAALAAEPAGLGVRLAKVGQFQRPTFVAGAPGDRRRVFVVEQRGTVRVLLSGRRLRKPFLDIRRLVRCCGEGGLLSIAFAPDYPRSRRVYAYYTDRRGGIAVDGFRSSRRAPNRVLPASRRPVLRQAHRTDNHKGGAMAFGPDGMLYLGLGDGGPQADPARRGQSMRTRLGKILRISPRRRGRGYTVPRSNPFAGRRGVRREIWAYGVRNPWRFSFTSRGSFVLGDLGQNEVEEVDYVVAKRRGRAPRGGYNFGWSVFEGTQRFRGGQAPGHRPPVLERRHSTGACGVIGGYVARDSGLSRLRGRYVYGDFCDDRLRTARLRPGRARGDRRLGLRVPGLSSFGEDTRRRLYATSIRGGVWRLAAARAGG